MLYTFLTGGVSWSPPAVIGVLNDGHRFELLGLAVDGKNRPHLVWTEESLAQEVARGGLVFYPRSVNGGDSRDPRASSMARTNVTGTTTGQVNWPSLRLAMIFSLYGRPVLGAIAGPSGRSMAANHGSRQNWWRRLACLAMRACAIS